MGTDGAQEKRGGDDETDSVGDAQCQICQSADRAKRIEVDLHSSATAVELSFRDFGPVAPSVALARLFDRFFRADSARTNPDSGIGLWCERPHRAQVSAENAAPGSMIRIRFGSDH